MSRRSCFWLVSCLVLAGIFGAILHSRTGSDVQASAVEARRSLRQQGFKTDLGDFDFSTDYQTAARAAALTNSIYTRPPRLLEACGTEAAIVAWKGSSFEEEEGYQNLPPVEAILTTNRAMLDSACSAALAGPTGFPLQAKQGSGILLVHLASLKGLSQALAARVVLDLRAEHYSDAWTNLLAVTRLATAWEPEPCEVSHLVRFNLARMAWMTTWQALQAHHWTEQQLSVLQQEWESADFFKGLPETAAFSRACAVDTCLRERSSPQPSFSLKDLLQTALHSPLSLVADVKYRWQRAQYRVRGTYEDEHDLLLFFRDRELELRKAIAAPIWREMRTLPGVTNTPVFRSKYSFSSTQALLNTRQIAVAFQREGKGFLGFAAICEARRRLVVTAMGLERYRISHGSYPKELRELSPDASGNFALDFMDGKPLRYRLGSPDAFVLYSIGLDCVDDGGKCSVATGPAYGFPRVDPLETPDIIWPRAASDAEVQALRLGQAQAKLEQRRQSQREAEDRERQAEESRRVTIAQLAALYAKGEFPKLGDPKLDGVPLTQVLRNYMLPGAALTLTQMLTLRQVLTGKEPDLVTFELPLSYAALTKIGALRLLCDVSQNDDSSSESAQLQDCEGATNGNCRLVWNTTYDPPGQHFLQAELSIRSRSRRNEEGQEIILKGPLFSFVSTNLLQFFPLGNVYTEKGAFFRVKLAHPIGSYSLEITDSSGGHIHTINGTTTNGIVEVHWNLLYNGGKRYTNDSFNSTWNVTFPDLPAAGAVPER